MGYQPWIRTTNFGALLEVTPRLTGGSEELILDLHSIVTVPTTNVGTGPPITFQQMWLDRTNVIVQQYATTLRMHLGRPVLVGSGTLEPLAADESDRQLYLIIEATAQ